MRVYGNIMNRLEECIAPQVPTVGMGATMLMFSDRYPYTIVEVNKNGKQIVIQEDIAKRKDTSGQDESQEWEITPNPDGEKKVATLRKNGAFMLAGESMRSGTVIRVGSRDRYYDFSY